MVAKLQPLPNLDNLADVNVPTPADGDVLYWNDVAGEWQCRAEDIFECGDLAGCSINALHDVLVTPTNKWIIYFNMATTRWEAQALSNWALSELGTKKIDNLDDVFAPVAIEGDMLYFDETSGLWMVGSRANLAELFANLTILNDLSDVQIPAPANLDFIYWDDTAGKWVNISYVNLLASIQGDTSLGELSDVTIAGLADGHFLSYSSGLGYWQNRLLAGADIPNLDAGKITTGTFALGRLPTSVKEIGIEFIIDGGGSAITTGQKGHLEIPFACTIQRATMLADRSGSIVVDIWKDTYANFPPTVADTITAAAKPTITTAQKSQDSTLTGWTTAITAGDILAFNVDSCSTITRVTLSLKVERT